MPALMSPDKKRSTIMWLGFGLQALDWAHNTASNPAFRIALAASHTALMTAITADQMRGNWESAKRTKNDAKEGYEAARPVVRKAVNKARFQAHLTRDRLTGKNVTPIDDSTAEQSA